MKKIEFAQKLKRGLVRAGLSLLAAAAVLAPTDAGAQITSLVVPRSYTILNNVLAGPTQVLSTNLNNGPGGSNIDTNGVCGGFSTLIPFGPAHPIGLTLTWTMTNALAHPSNTVVVVYPAYDQSGTTPNVTAGLNTRFGTNVSATPILTWTVSTTTNTVQSTNIIPALWEPATALYFVVSNVCNSNMTYTLIATIPP